jgi:hypothetical protein
MNPQRTKAGAAVLVFLVILKAPAQEVLRGEVRLDMEPVYGFYVDESPRKTKAMEAPLAPAQAARRAAKEAVFFYGAMIYGWSFHYEVGERARGIEEELHLSSLGSIALADPRFEITDTRIEETSLYLWSDYRPSEAQRKRMAMWKTGQVRSAQAMGHGPLGYAPLPPSNGPAEDETWLEVKKASLEDAARAAVRSVLRGAERNRPKEAAGYISLAAFPRFWLDAGQWAASGRFLISVTEITPFAVH